MRLDQLTSRMDPQHNRAPFAAIFRRDGSVKVYHHRLDNRTFSGEESYRQWVTDNGLDKGGIGDLRLMEIKSQDKMPEVS